MAQTCPSCGAELPEEAGQHALVPSAGVVECPNCGETVTLAKAGAAEEERTVASDEGTGTFAGHETVEGVMDELSEKEGE
jgi:predicted RNA-binding Zn-ribbon protein involved in translation (DUF1610 family)